MRTPGARGARRRRLGRRGRAHRGARVGCPFDLEEPLRAGSDGVVYGVPETVQAMVQSRLESLDADTRRVLRAASVFGERFRLPGVVALLGGARNESEVQRWLEVLVRAEVVTWIAPGADRAVVFSSAWARPARAKVWCDLR